MAVSLSHTLKDWIEIPDDSDPKHQGKLILAWTNLGTLVENSLKFFLSAYLETYKSDPSAKVNRNGDLITPDSLRELYVNVCPFKMIGDKAYGPGVSDEKASHVSVLYTLKLLRERGSDAYKNVHMIFNSDEEIGSRKSKAIIKEASISKKFSLAVESGRPDDGIVTERKGTARRIFPQ